MVLPARSCSLPYLDQSPSSDHDAVDAGRLHVLVVCAVVVRVAVAEDGDRGKSEVIRRLAERLGDLTDICKPAMSAGAQLNECEGGGRTGVVGLSFVPLLTGATVQL